MNIELLNWDPVLLHTFKIPPEILPEIRSSSEIYGKVADDFPLQDVPISGVSRIIEIDTECRNLVFLLTGM